MKRTVLLVALAITTTAAFAQTSAPAASLATGERYEVYSERGVDDAKAIAKALDAYYALFDSTFRFDYRSDGRKLRVRMAASKESFDTYLKAALGSTRDDVVYLHYSRPERSELVLFPKSDGLFDRAFAHQAFIQYLRAFVANPPLWVREGFAIVFESAKYDATLNTVLFPENLSWLETVKSMGGQFPSIPDVLLATDSDSIPPTKLYPAAWALASFLMNGKSDIYKRFLWESLLILDPQADASANAQAVAYRGSVLVSPEQALKDFNGYLSSRKTFGELIEEGRAAYAAKDNSKAEAAFIAAAELRNDHYAPHYYLGLLAYERKEYALAETHYRTALQMGAEEAVVEYALGVNAAADGRDADARSHLESARALAPARYAARVEELLKRLH